MTLIIDCIYNRNTNQLKFLQIFDPILTPDKRFLYFRSTND